MSDIGSTPARIAAIEAAVRAVPGVVALYAPAIGDGLVVVRADSVSVSIAVDAAIQAPTTATLVATAIRSLLPSTVVTVRISRIL